MPAPVTALGVALVALMVVASAVSLPLNYRYPKQDFGAAMQFVDHSEVELERLQSERSLEKKRQSLVQ